MLVFVTFLMLAAVTFLIGHARAKSLARNASDWVLDGTGLIVQGAGVPALQIVIAYTLLNIVLPGAKGSIDVDWIPTFLLNFVVVDYIYYWNHRLLHSKALWATHAVHHTPKAVDVFITSRNTLWTPLLIVYVWANGLFLFLLKDPYPFLLSASITASLDLWRHTTFAPRPGSLLHRAIAVFLITPNEHIWHHSSDRADRNFGANLSLWDRLHGTYYSPSYRPPRLGIPSGLDLRHKLLFPFGYGKTRLPL